MVATLVQHAETFKQHPDAKKFQPNKKNIKSSQLLTFCDASEEAVAAAVYLNTSYEDGSSIIADW